MCIKEIMGGGGGGGGGARVATALVLLASYNTVH